MRYRYLLSFLAVLLYGFSCFATPKVTLDSSNLPILIMKIQNSKYDVDTAYNQYIHMYMWLVDNGPGKYNHVRDSAKFRLRCGAHLHGASSLGFDKKSYAIQMEDSNWQVTDVPLLGMPKEHDWDLIASYMDRSLMRNILSQHVFQSMGNYSPRYKQIEVVINNDYKGIYACLEKAKRSSNRINIQKMLPTDNSGDALTGGYVIKTDWNSTIGWSSKYNQPIGGAAQIFGYDDPGSPSAAQQKYIKSFYDSFEAKLYNGKITNAPDTSWRHFADGKSISDYMLVQEMSKNLDDYRASFFMWKNRNSIDRRIHCGPVWDFDIAWYDAGYNEAQYFYGYEYCAGDPSSGSTDASWWWFKLMGNNPPGLKKGKLKSYNYGTGDSAWMGELKCDWTIYRRGFASDASMNNWIDSNQRLLMDGSISATATGAVKRNFTRWPVFGTSFWDQEVFLAKNFKQECDTLKGFIHRRFAWLDKYLPGTCLRDLDPPTVQLKWKDTVQLEVNTNYVDSGIIFHDNFGDSNVKIVVGNSLDSSTLGFYRFTYFVYDKAGNKASVNRVIQVIDTIAPTIVFTNGDTITTEVLEKYIDNGVVVKDNYDASPIVSTVTNFNFSNNIPDSLGIYYIWYKAIDQSGNIDSAIRYIKVVDTYAPIINLHGSDSVKLEVYSMYSDSNVTVKDNFDTLATLSKHGNLRNYKTDSLGTYTMWYKGTDHSGNKDSVRRTIIVIDSIAPVITMTGGDSAFVFQDSTYADSGYIASDNYDKHLKIDTSGTYLNTQMVGIYTISYKATDQSGNRSATITREVKVMEKKVDTTGSGINGMNNAGSAISIYPNPGTGEFRISVKLNTKDKANLSLLDITGREVEGMNFEVYNGWDYTLHIENLPVGIYNLKLQTKNSISTAKLILIK